MAVNMNLAYKYDGAVEVDEKTNEYDDEIRKLRNENKRKKNLTNLKIIAAAVIVLVLFTLITLCKMELSALYTQNAELTAELTHLQNENLSLESELAQKTGLTKVEDYAENQLGLQKLDKSQIEYVEVAEKTTAEPADTGNDNFFVKIKDKFEGIMEYLGL